MHFFNKIGRKTLRCGPLKNGPFGSFTEKRIVLINFQFPASKYTEPEELKDPIEPFQQIGPPRNLSVTRHSHAYVAEWEQPEYGMDQFRFYILKWWKEPQHKQMGQVETADTFYICKLSI